MTLDSNVLRDIGALSRSIHSINDIRFKQYHLQRSQFIFLTRICEHPGLTQIALTSLLKVDKATTAKAVQKLIAEGYVVKTRDEKDKRAWNLFPTSAAKAVYEPIVAEENRNIAICFDGFTKAERDMLCRMVARMSGNIDKEWKKYKNYKI